MLQHFDVFTAGFCCGGLLVVLGIVGAVAWFMKKHNGEIAVYRTRRE